MPPLFAVDIHVRSEYRAPKPVMIKPVLFSAVLMFLSIACFSQIVFEKGYFIDESNQRIECLVRNVDWRNNPTEFEYKMSEDSDLLRASIGTVTEFGVDNVSKWVRATVDIDQSGDGLNDLSKERNPVFEEKRVFLKVLIEGKASLFLFREGNLTRFFYRKDDSEIRQLVYKRYFIEKKIAHNNLFHQQLASELMCQSMKPNDAGKLMYVKRDLEKYFIRYNECSGSNNTSYEPKGKRDVFDLAIRAGFNHSSLSINNASSDSRDFDFDNEPGFRIGLGFEYILPFNKSKWSIFLDPTYQYYKTEKIQKTPHVSNGELSGQVDYKSVELAMGVRHYFFLNDRSKIFADVSFVVDFSGSSNVEFSRTNDGRDLICLTSAVEKTWA